MVGFSGDLHACPPLSLSGSRRWPRTTWLLFVCFHLVWFSFYTNLLHVSETLFKEVYSIWLFLWLKKKEKLTILPKAFYALVRQKGAIFKSVPTLSRIYSLQSK